MNGSGFPGLAVSEGASGSDNAESRNSSGKSGSVFQLVLKSQRVLQLEWKLAVSSFHSTGPRTALDVCGDKGTVSKMSDSEEASKTSEES